MKRAVHIFFGLAMGTAVMLLGSVVLDLFIHVAMKIGGQK